MAGPPRRRGAELEQAILRAAVDELAESGYAGLTMDRVAHRAGTNPAPANSVSSTSHGTFPPD